MRIFSLSFQFPFQNGTNPVCGDIFTKNGYNISTFAVGVGHGLHSLSLEELRFYFDEDAPEDNNIPTVNINLKDEEAVLDHTPLRGYEDRFNTWALKIMDLFMLNSNRHLLQKVHKLLNLYKINKFLLLGPKHP